MSPKSHPKGIVLASPWFPVVLPAVFLVVITLVVTTSQDTARAEHSATCRSDQMATGLSELIQYEEDSGAAGVCLGGQPGRLSPLGIVGPADLLSPRNTPSIPDSPQQSRTGPTPPAAVLERDAAKLPDRAEDVRSAVTLPVPAYMWRHGCGPTALAMVVGYYDMNGLDDLIPGPASSQTDAVDQAIASGGSASSPFPPGSERHYEDYARPEDSYPDMVVDDYISSGRPPHADDSIADYMHTSKSTHGNYYGWSWSNHVGPAFVSYVQQQNATYVPHFQNYFAYDNTLTWAVLTSEIDAGRPMVFLVDTDGNGGTDHFVTVVGYRTSPTLQYGAWDTWSTDAIRWENFAYIGSGVPWGVWGGTALKVSLPLTVSAQGNGVGRIVSMPAGIDCGTTCAAVFAHANAVTLTATAYPGSNFEGWGGACTNTSGPCVTAMNEARHVIATFVTTATDATYLPLMLIERQ